MAGSSSAANEVLSAHSTIATLKSMAAGVATFGVRHYLRYAQLSAEAAEGPQPEWSVVVGEADAQTSRFVDEAVGSLTGTIRALAPGALVSLDWVQVRTPSGGSEHPCQKLEPLTEAAASVLLAASDEVQILGLGPGMEDLLRRAKRHPGTLRALHGAQAHTRAMAAVRAAAEGGVHAASDYFDDEEIAALLRRLDAARLFPQARPTEAHGREHAGGERSDADAKRDERVIAQVAPTAARLREIARAQQA